MGKVETMATLPLLGRASAEGRAFLDAEIAEDVKKVFCGCGAGDREGCVVTRAQADDYAPADDVVRGVVVGDAGLDAEMHDKDEPRHGCNGLAMVAGAIGVGWGQMPGDAEEGHADVIVAEVCNAPDHGRANYAVGYDKAAAVPIESQVDVDVLERQNSMCAGDAGGIRACGGAIGIDVDAAGGGVDGALMPGSGGDVGRPESWTDVEMPGDAGATEGEDATGNIPPRATGSGGGVCINRGADIGGADRGLRLAAPTTPSTILAKAATATATAKATAARTVVAEAVTVPAGHAAMGCHGVAMGCASTEIGRGLGQEVGEGVVRGVREAVGEVVGDAVGVAVGEAVGGAVGMAIGEAVGEAVGEAAGEAGGEAVGEVVSDTAGVAVGEAVGEAVGTAISEAVGEADGEAAGEAVGGAVGMATGEAVDEAVGEAAGETNANSRIWGYRQSSSKIDKPCLRMVHKLCLHFSAAACNFRS
jgi:hypothetical protein